MKISADKKYTSNGHPVEFLHRAPEGFTGQYPWRGITNGDELTWTGDGRYSRDGKSRFDLVEAREPAVVYLNEYENGFGNLPTHLTPEQAKEGAGASAIRTAVPFREVLTWEDAP